MSHYILRIVLLAIIYLVFGKLGLMLAIPPGYASAFFPAAGIALAAVLLYGNKYLPGIFLGSFLLNLSISYSTTAYLNLQTFYSPISIATGAMLQAYLGALLIKKYTRQPVTLIHDKDIIIFILLGGFLSCLINASIGVSSLFFSKSISGSEFFFSWWNWWIGDTLGVMVAVPTVFVFCARPRRVWKSRIITVAAPLMLTCALVIYMFVQFSNSSLNRMRLQFTQQSEQITDTILFRTEVYIKELISLERFITATGYINRNQFRTFVSTTLKNNPSIQALEWLPKVTHDKRAAFEQSVQKEGYPDFHIREKDTENKIIVAKKRSEYFPVAYVEPYLGNIKAFGYDVASNPVRREALDRAASSGQATMTGRINLVQDTHKHAGALIFYPVYRAIQPEQRRGNRKNELLGFVSGVFRMTDLIQAAMQNFPQQDFNLRIIDITENTNETMYGDHEQVLIHPDSNVVAIHKVHIAGRDFLFEFYPTRYFFESNRSWQAWLVLAAGLFFAGLLGAYLLSITGRTQKSEYLVDRRTNELRSILENAVEAILTFSPGGIIQSANPAAHRLFGYQANQLIGKNMQNIVPDSMRTLLITHNHGQSLEMKALHQDGTEFPIEFGINKIILPDHIIYTCIIHDLTAREKIDRLKNEFISMVSHELRTPITAIRGSLGLISAGVVGNLSEKLQQLVDISLKNSERLVNIVNDILNIEKLEFSSFDFNYAEYNIHQLIQESIEQNRNYATQFEVALKYLTKPDVDEPLIVVTDKDRFYQVMANLISNAIKFSDPGGRVEIETEPLADDIKIAIQDYGRGIPENFRQDIFKKFSQADTSDTRKRGGTGLGLNIVKTMVTKMSGSLYYETEEGQGTTFFFTLPRKHQDETNQA